MNRMLVLGVVVFFGMVGLALLGGETQAVAAGGCSGKAACCGAPSDCGGCSGRCGGRRRCRPDRCSGCSGRRAGRRNRCSGCAGGGGCKGVMQKGGGAMQKGAGAVQHGAAQHGGATQKGATQKGAMQKASYSPVNAGLFRNTQLVYRRVIFR